MCCILIFSLFSQCKRANIFLNDGKYCNLMEEQSVITSCSAVKNKEKGMNRDYRESYIRISMSHFCNSNIEDIRRTFKTQFAVLKC